MRRGLALWGSVFKGMVGVALEGAARRLLVVVSGVVSVYVVEVEGVAVQAIVLGVLLVPVQAGALSLRVLLVEVVAGGWAGVIHSCWGRAGVH